MKDQKKNNKGFSLVELIVVVAIMAVLLGVLVPTLVRNVEKSKYQKDINNLTEVRNAIQVAMATEEYAGVECKIECAGSSFSIKSDGTTTGITITDASTGFDATAQAGFFKEVLANLNGSADYTYTYTSKLKNDTGIKTTFTLASEKVNGVITTNGTYKDKSPIQLQDQAAGSAAAGEGK